MMISSISDRGEGVYDDDNHLLIDEPLFRLSVEPFLVWLEPGRSRLSMWLK
jgi:hypothetical protein